MYPYYLRTSRTTDFKGYVSLVEARLALENLVNSESVDATSVTEEPGGKWTIRRGPQDHIKIWIENDKLETVPLNATHEGD